eukprot:gene36678-biopygen17962
MSLGLDSLGATELANRLSKELDVKLLPTLVFSYPSVKEISGYIYELLGGGDDEDEDENEGIRAGMALGGSMAVVGMACRFPQNVNSPSDFWRVLLNKEDLTGEASLTRWDSDAVIHSMEGLDSKQLDPIRY